jgi:signal transduction histidine kinase
VDLSFSLLKDEAGQVIGAFAIGRDATARHLEEVARREIAGQPG